MVNGQETCLLIDLVLMIGRKGDADHEPDLVGFCEGGNLEAHDASE